jgi:hypothetical protein
MKKNVGLLFDFNLEVVSKLMKDRCEGEFVFISGETNSNTLFERAVAEKKIFITKDVKILKANPNELIIVLPYKNKNEKWFQSLISYFGLADKNQEES